MRKTNSLTPRPNILEDPANETPHPVDHPTWGFFATCRRGLTHLANGLAALGRKLSAWFDALRRFMGFGGRDDGAATPPSASFAASEPPSEHEDEVSDSEAHGHNLVITPDAPDEKRGTPERRTSDVLVVEDDAQLHPDHLPSAEHHASDLDTHNDSPHTTSASLIGKAPLLNEHKRVASDFEVDSQSLTSAPVPLETQTQTPRKHPPSVDPAVADAPAPLQPEALLPATHHPSDPEAHNDNAITTPSDSLAAFESPSDDEDEASDSEVHGYSLTINLADFEEKRPTPKDSANGVTSVEDAQPQPEAPRPVQHHASDFEAHHDHTFTAPLASAATPELSSEHKLEPSNFEASSHSLILDLFEAKLQIAEEGASEISCLVRGDYKDFGTTHDDWYFDCMQSWRYHLDALLMTLRDTQEHATGPELKNENIRKRIDALTNMMAENASLLQQQRVQWDLSQNNPPPQQSNPAYYWSQYCHTEQQLLSSLAEEKTQVSQDLLRLWIENMSFHLSCAIYCALCHERSYLDRPETPAHWSAATLCIHVFRCKLNIPWQSDDIVGQVIQQMEQPGLRVLEALAPRLATLASGNVPEDKLEHLGDNLRETCSLSFEELESSNTLSLGWKLKWCLADAQTLRNLSAPYIGNTSALRDNFLWRAQHIQALRLEKEEEANRRFTAWKTTLRDILTTEIDSNAYVTSEEPVIQQRILHHRKSLYYWTDMLPPEPEANILQQFEAKLALIEAKLGLVLAEEDNETHQEPLAATFGLLV